jgi:hypothetical protein
VGALADLFLADPGKRRVISERKVFDMNVFDPDFFHPRWYSIRAWTSV